jgi:hypothetical protein
MAFLTGQSSSARDFHDGCPQKFHGRKCSAIYQRDFSIPECDGCQGIYQEWSPGDSRSSPSSSNGREEATSRHDQRPHQQRIQTRVTSSCCCRPASQSQYWRCSKFWWNVWRPKKRVGYWLLENWPGLIWREFYRKSHLTRGKCPIW